MPGDVLQFGSPASLQLTFKVKMCHVSVFEQLESLLPGNIPPSEAKLSAAAIPQPVSA